jgi:hypothetical protein
MIFEVNAKKVYIHTAFFSKKDAFRAWPHNAKPTIMALGAERKGNKKAVKV